jgi:hypothetical protein
VAGAAKEDAVNYMLLIYHEPDGYASLPPDVNRGIYEEYLAFTQALIDKGEFVSGDALQGIETATTVRGRRGRRHLTDGPFAETKEVLGGYYIVDVADLDRALELAGQLPGVRHEIGSVEVRPLANMPQDRTD